MAVLLEGHRNVASTVTALNMNVTRNYVLMQVMSLLHHLITPWTYGVLLILRGNCSFTLRKNRCEEICMYFIIYG
jgi:hypothetical protein